MHFKLMLFCFLIGCIVFDVQTRVKLYTDEDCKEEHAEKNYISETDDFMGKMYNYINNYFENPKVKKSVYIRVLNDYFGNVGELWSKYYTNCGRHSKWWWSSLLQNDDSICLKDWQDDALSLVDDVMAVLREFITYIVNDWTLYMKYFVMIVEHVAVVYYLKTYTIPNLMKPDNAFPEYYAAGDSVQVKPRKAHQL